MAGALKSKSGVTDGATAVGHEFDTESSLSTSGAKLLSIKNAGVEKAAMDKDGNITVAELQIKVHSQDAEPTLGADSFMAIWIDTNDSNRVYLIFRRGTGDQVKIELT